MKKNVLALFCAVALSAIVNAAPNDTLMLIGNTPVLVSEFEYVYGKNNQNSLEQPKTLDEYIELYENFKLKVIEAERLGLDTAASFRNELNGYRNQLKGAYLTDNEKFAALVQEAYERSLEDVDVSHIMVQIMPNATPEDTLRAYEKALRARARLLKGEPFEAVAREMSEDGSASRNGGRLGFITSMRTIYPFETAVYAQTVGVVSEPIRTPIGYHIILVHERRKNVGEIHAKHILKSVNARMSDDERARAKAQIDSIAEQLRRGDSFEELAQKHSDDHQNAVNGGDLSWFGLGRMVRDFETAAFALQNIGDVSDPVLSPFGWHLIKLEGRRTPDAATKKKELERMLVRDPRMALVRQSFVEKLKKEYNFVENAAALDEIRQVFASTPNDTLAQEKCSALNKPLFTFADQTALQRDFAMLLFPNPRRVGLDDDYATFVSNCLIQYEDAQLERKHTDFSNLMREYHDGILLFELSNREVWEKATKDTLGLKNYFEANRKKYKFENPCFKGFVVQCADKNVAKALKKIVKNANPDSVLNYVAQRINVDSIPVAKVERGLWKKGENAFVDKLEFKQKTKPSTDENYPVVFTVGQKILYPNDYTDVRGRVVSDYQGYLEQLWIKELRELYPITIFEKVKKSISQKQ